MPDPNWWQTRLRSFRRMKPADGVTVPAKETCRKAWEFLELVSADLPVTNVTATPEGDVGVTVKPRGDRWVYAQFYLSRATAVVFIGPGQPWVVYPVNTAEMVEMVTKFLNQGE